MEVLRRLGLGSFKVSHLGAFAYMPWFPPFLSIAVSGFLLGCAFAASVVFILLYFYGIISSFAAVGIAFYVIFGFVMFHFAEFACAVLYRPHDCSPESFLFFHSLAFLIAHALAWIELLVRLHLYGDAQWSWVRILAGSAAAVYFYGIRVRAMVEARDNFSFKIEVEKRQEHQLVKTGVFSWLRHPSYFGSFWYFLAVQFIAGNTVCLVLFVFVLRHFFKMRIEDEEELLESEQFFGEEYSEYKKTTRVGLPLLNSWPFFC